MKRVLLFAGATEGRELAEFLTGFPVELTVSTATEYGASLLPRGERVTCLSGRLDQGEMEGVIRQGGYRWVVDATHPYATQAGENIRRACEAVGVPLLRLSRQLDRPMEGAIAVPDAQAAAQLLNEIGGKGASHHGEQGTPYLYTGEDFAQRLYPRVLPLPAVVEECLRWGICPPISSPCRGLFPKSLTRLFCSQTGCSILVTSTPAALEGF